MSVKFFIPIFLLCSLSGFAQYPDNYEPLNSPSSGDTTSNSTGTVPSDLSNQSFWDRVNYGGNLQLSFGAVTYIEVSPRIGYRITEDLTSGVGLNYIYIRYAQNFFYNGSPSTSLSIYGGNVFSTYKLPIGFPIALHGEFEALRYDVFEPSTNQFEPQWVPALRLGGGYFQPIGRGGGVFILGLYDVLYEPGVSLNRSPWSVRVNFLF